MIWLKMSSRNPCKKGELVLHNGTQSWQLLSDLTHKAKPQGGQFHDARIAALCIKNGVSALYSADRDFGRFKALKTINPLVD